jgi:hypothetical protein
MPDLPSTELGMANEDTIARATKTPTFKKWSALSNNSVLQYGSMHFKKVVNDAERLEVENKISSLRAFVLLAKTARSKLCRKNKAERIIKII